MQGDARVMLAKNDRYITLKFEKDVVPAYFLNASGEVLFPQYFILRTRSSSRQRATLGTIKCAGMMSLTFHHLPTLCRRLASQNANSRDQRKGEGKALAYLSVKASTGECGAVAMNADTASRCLMGSAGTRTTKFPSSLRSAS